MSNLNTNNQEDKNEVFLSTKGRNWLLGLGAIILVILFIVLVQQSNKSVNTSDTSVATASDATATTEEQLMSDVIEADTSESFELGNVSIANTVDATVAKQLQTIQESIDKAYKNNALIFLIMGEEDTDRVAQIYNKDYQAYTEWSSNATEIFYERGKSIQIADKLIRNNNITAFDTLQGVLDLAKADTEGVTVEVESEDIYTNTGSEEVVVDGESSVEESTEADKGEYLYTQTRTTITIENSALNTYYEKYGNAYENMSTEVWDEMTTDDDKTNDKLIYDIITTNVDDMFSAGEYIVLDGTEYISWYFENYYALEDWSLDAEEWKKEHTVQEFIDLTVEFQKTVQTMAENLQADVDAQLESLEALSETITESVANETEVSEESVEETSEVASE